MSNIFNNIIRDKLNSYELDYDHNEWLRLEKKLPNKPFIGSISGNIFIASILVIVAVIIYVAINDFNNESLISVKIQESDIIHNSEITAKETIFINQLVNHSQNTAQNIETNQITKVEKHNHIDISTESKSEDNTETIANTKDSKEIKNEIKAINHALNIKDFYAEVIIKDNCEPSTVQFNSYNLPENYEIIWDTDNNYTLKGKSTYTVYEEAGNYLPRYKIFYEKLEIQSGILKSIEILPSPIINFSYTNNDNIYYFSVDKNHHSNFVVWNINNDIFYDSELRFEFNKSDICNIKIIVSNEFGCKSEKNTQIEVKIEQTYYLPNAFIPSSDNINSYFGPIGENLTFEVYKMIIADQNGRKVFESDNVDNKWNGKLNNIGENLKEGIYLWEIYTIDALGESEIKKGRVNLLRK